MHRSTFRRIVVASLILVSALFSLACGAAALSGQSPTPSDAVQYDFKYPGKITSEQDAIDAVLAFMQSETKSDEARLYTAEYLMAVPDKKARPGMAPEGQTWYVTFSMDRKPDGGEGEKAYWNAAAWVVFSDGKVMPSSRHNGNAARILQDLRNASR